MRPGKRVILSMGGKGGVGKPSVMASLAEWFDGNQIPAKLLNLDTQARRIPCDKGCFKYLSGKLHIRDISFIQL
jgi:MinD superfamily P-loop ATPase